MKQRYIEDYTKDWELLECKGNLELHSFFDKVDWTIGYAIKRDSEVVYTFTDGYHGNIYAFFNAVSIIC